MRGSQPTYSEIPLSQSFRDIFVCSQELADRIAEKAFERRYPSRTLIARQGDILSTTFLLIHGRVHALSYGPDGQAVLVQEFLSGDFFGAILDDTRVESPTDFLAIERVRLAAFLILDFLVLAERQNCVSLALSKMLLRQLRATAQKITERTTMSAPGRVCAELLRIAKSNKGRISPPPVLSKLALRVQTTRETVSRTISGLERRGIIRRDATGIQILASHRLEELIL